MNMQQTVAGHKMLANIDIENLRLQLSKAGKIARKHLSKAIVRHNENDNNKKFKILFFLETWSMD